MSRAEQLLAMMEGKTKIPKYVADLKAFDGHVMTVEWKGTPDIKKLEAYCQAFNDSVRDGVNKHLGKGAICVSASIRDNHGGAKPTVTWKDKNAPKFMVV